MPMEMHVRTATGQLRRQGLPTKLLIGLRSIPVIKVIVADSKDDACVNSRSSTNIKRLEI